MFKEEKEEQARMFRKIAELQSKPTRKKNRRVQTTEDLARELNKNVLRDSYIRLMLKQQPEDEEADEIERSNNSQV